MKPEQNWEDTEIVQYDILPRTETVVGELQQTAYGPFRANGDIQHHLTAYDGAYFIERHYYDRDDYADPERPRIIETMARFHSEADARQWAVDHEDMER